MKKNVIIAIVLGIFAIVLGAFTTHALSERLGESALKSMETAIQYHLFHVLVLLIVNLDTGFTEKAKNRISYVFFAGIAFFSGSIYIIYLLNVDPSMIWFITPLGGLLLILGWVLMLIQVIRRL